MSSYNDRRQARADVTIDILPPEDGARGEAKAGQSRSRSRNGNTGHFRRPLEVVDAHFVSVGRSPQQPAAGRVPGNATRAANSGRSFTAAVPASPRVAAARMVAGVEKRLMRMSPDAFLALVSAVVVAVFTLFGGFSLIPDGASAADSGPAIDITHVTMTPQDANGMRVLLINGIVENRTGDRLVMPQIRADLLAGEAVVATTLISTAASQIGGGESYGFTARVPHPGGKLPDLRLSLAERGA